MTDVNLRKPAHPIDAMFLERWSPRAFTDEVISEADLLTILEAARWAPSSFNAQPWRFLYARRRTPQWEKFLQLLVPFNKGWAKDAAALIVLVSNSMSRPSGGDEDVPSYTHSLDAGTASGYFALQANRLGWHAHGMVGFNIDRACKDLNVPPGYRVEAVYAIGRKGDPAHLPAQLRAREFPSDRLPLCELAFEGGFPTDLGNLNHESAIGHHEHRHGSPGDGLHHAGKCRGAIGSRSQRTADLDTTELNHKGTRMDTDGDGLQHR